MDKRKQLFRHKHPYDLPGTEPLFVEAMAQNAQFQYANCAVVQHPSGHLGGDR